jgi:hypothetical protein
LPVVTGVAPVRIAPGGPAVRLLSAMAVPSCQHQLQLLRVVVLLLFAPGTIRPVRRSPCADVTPVGTEVTPYSRTYTVHTCSTQTDDATTQRTTACWPSRLARAPRPHVTGPTPHRLRLPQRGQ